MAQPILVTQSTSIVQVDTSQVTFGSPAVVLLSTLNAPGVLVTIRDIAGAASTNRGVVVSTTQGVHFLDGPSCNIYSITQPYGFLTVTPKTSSIWAVTNTFAFPEGSSAANVNQFTANFATVSSLFANQAILSTVGISSLSTDTTQVRYNLSVGQSSITDTAYVKGELVALSSISTAGGIYAGSTVTTRDIFASGHIQASCIQIQQSTGYALQVGGAAQFASTISTHRNLDVGGSISTQGNLVVGGNFAINGGLQLTGLAITGGVSTSGTLGVARDAQLLSSLLVKDDGYFYRSVSVSSNLFVGGSISTLNSLAASSIVTRGQVLIGTTLSVMSSIYAGGNVSVAGDLAVAGNLVFNDVVLDLNALSVFSTLTVGALISTTGNIAAGQGLRVMGSTILQGLVSTASSINVGGSISTTGNLAVGGSVDLRSTLTVRGAVTKLGDVNVGGLLSTQSTLVVGDSIRVNSNLYVGGVLSSLSTVNAAGNLLVGGQAFLSSGLSTLGSVAFFSSVQIQGSVSVMSSLVVRQDVTVQGTLNAAGFSLPGAAAVASLGVQTSTGVSAVFASSTIQTGLLSTLGGINMGGQFSTPNTITTGSTLNARFVVATSNISSLGTLGVGGDMSLSGRGTFCNLTVTSNLVTTTNSSNVFAGCNIFSNVPYFNAGFNGDLAQNYAMGNITAAGNLGVSQAATFSNQVTAQSNLNTSSLTVTGNTLMSNFMSTLGQAAFFSSVAIQGNLSVFSSVNVSCNLTVGGTLTATNVQLPGGAILQTLAVTSNVGFTVNISSSTLHAGLFSTSGAIFSGREISTTSSIIVGGIGRFQSGISTLGQASYASNVQVNGVLVSLSTVVGPSISAMRLQASSLGLGVANSSNVLDVAGTVAVQGTGRSNTVRLTATDNAPGITLSNTTANYTLFNTKTGDVPGAGALAVLDNSENYRMVMFPNGNTAIGKSSAAAPLDVNGLALADRMGAPLAQFSTLGSRVTTTSTLGVNSFVEIFGVGLTGAAHPLYVNATRCNTGIQIINTATPLLGLCNDTIGSQFETLVVTNSNEGVPGSAPGDAIIRTRATSRRVILNNGIGLGPGLALRNNFVGIQTATPAFTLDVNGTANVTSLQASIGSISSLRTSSITASTISLGVRSRINIVNGANEFYIDSDDALTFSENVYSAFFGFIDGFATNGNIILGYGLNGGVTFSYNGRTWSAGIPYFYDNFQTVTEIIWDGARFVAVGDGSTSVATSVDGLNWTSVANVGTIPYTIAFNGSLYVGVTYNGGIVTTPNLVDWSPGIGPFSEAGVSIAWTGKLWVASALAGSVNIFATSPDGITWTPNVTLNSLITSPCKGIVVNGTTVVVGGEDGNSGVGAIAYSFDSGVTWTAATMPGPFFSLRIGGLWWDGTYFFALAVMTDDPQSQLFYSARGHVWNYLPGGGMTLYTPSTRGIGINFSTRPQIINYGLLATDSISTTGTITSGESLRIGPSTLVANTLLQNVGINCNAPRFTLDVNGDINTGGNLRVAGTIFQGGGSTGPTISTNRIFTSTMTTSSMNVTNNLLASNATTPKYFIAGGNTQSAPFWLRSTDGITWTTISGAPNTMFPFTLSYNGFQWVAGGQTTGGAGRLFTSSNGTTWTAVVPTGYANFFVQNINWNGSYYLISGTDNTSGSSNVRCITRTTDFTSFTAAASAVFNGGVARCTAWNGSLWVAVGKDVFTSPNPQCIRYSFDGLNWSNVRGGFGSSSVCEGICVVWNGRMFVAGGADSTGSIAAAVMKYSYDGIVWYDCLGVVGRAATVRTILNVAWNGKRFVAVGLGGGFVRNIIWSDDGINWSSANATFSGEGDNIVWNGNLWVASGQDAAGANSIRYSLDGINWTAGSGLSGNGGYFTWALGWSSNLIADAQIGNTYFYSGQANNYNTSPTSTNTVQLFSNALLLNQLYTDTTGKVGIDCNAPETALGVNGFVTINNQAPINVAVIGTNDTTIANILKYSLDHGQTWNNCILNPVPSAGGVGAMAWNGSYFLTALFPNGSDAVFYSSSNGIVWNSNPMVGESNFRSIRGLCWAPPFWVAVGQNQLANNSNTSILRSLDGVTWSRATSGGFASTFGAGSVTGAGQSVAFNGRRLVATGQDSFNSQIKYSDDLGATWVTAYGYSQLPFQVIRTVATNGRVWVASALNAGPNSMMYSTDGANWVPTNFTFPGALNVGIEWNGTLFVATGNGWSNTPYNFDKTIAYSYDGFNWSWGSNTYVYTANANNVIWTGRNFIAMGSWATASTIGSSGFFRIKTSVDGITWSNVASTQNPSWSGIGGIASIAYSSNVYADLQVENLAIYGRNQFPFAQSTNRINVSNSNITINNGLIVASNGFMGYATTNPRAAFDVLGGGGANNLFVQTIAGSLTAAAGMQNGYATNALLSRPIGVAVDSNQNVFFSDFNNNRIRVVFSNGVVSTLAGNGSNTSVDGVGALATFAGPHGISINLFGTELYVCDYATHVIRRVVISTGTVTTIAGLSGSAGFVNGTGSAARFNNPINCILRVNQATLYVADNGNNAIRGIDLTNSNVYTFAGSNTVGRVDAVACNARFWSPIGLAVTASALFVADTNNNMIRQITIADSVVSTIAGAPTGGGTSAGSAAVTQGFRSGAALNGPQGITFNPASNLLYIMNSGTTTGTISAYDFNNSGFVSVWANGGFASSINVIDGSISTAKFTNPRLMTTDPVGNIYIAEDGNGNRIRKITSNYTSSIAALSFDYSGGGLSHYIRSRHMPTDGRSAENAIDFFINTSFNTLSSISTGSGNTLAASITAAGVGIGTATPSNMLHVTQDLPFSYRGLNPLPAQVMIGSVSATMKLGTYYTGGQGVAGVIQVADSYWGDDRNPAQLLLNPRGGTGWVGIGTSNVAAPFHVATNTGTTIMQNNSGGGASGVSTSIVFTNNSYSQAAITTHERAASNGGAWRGAMAFHTYGNIGGVETLFERMRINEAGNVGIGQSNPAYALDVVGTIQTNIFDTGIGGVIRLTPSGSGNILRYGGQESILRFVGVGDVEAARLSYGRLGIGTIAPSTILDVNGQLTLTTDTWHQSKEGIQRLWYSLNGQTYYNGRANSSFNNLCHIFRTQNNVRDSVVINDAGNVGIGDTNPQMPLTFAQGDGDKILFSHLGGGVGSKIAHLASWGMGYYAARPTDSTANGFHAFYTPNGTNYVERMRINATGVNVVGALSKSSGSFEIEHPVRKGYRLVHSFIEGPRVDLIYRGSKKLVNGTITVDLEKESTANGSTMTPGTFDALCTNPEFFLQNNDTFDRVKGSISSHILTIQCENPTSEAMINWMVIAERKDPWIKVWDKTDSNGFLVLEHPESPDPMTRA